jgi:hypothetical protein
VESNSKPPPTLVSVPNSDCALVAMGYEGGQTKATMAKMS